MKNKIFYLIALAVAALSLGSCADNWEPESANKGELRLSSIGIEVSDAETVVSRADIDLNPFIISVYTAQSEFVKEWTYKDMPEIFSLPVGDYIVKVRSHEPETAAWEKPYYEGEENFSIKANTITNIGVVTCYPKALKVSVLFDDDLKNKMDNDVEVTVIAGDGGSIVFTPAETRSAYFRIDQNNGEDNTLIATFVGTVNGYKENIRKQFTGVKPGEHYIINFRFRTNPLEPDPETGLIDPKDGVNVDTDIIIDNSQNGTVDNDEELIEGDPNHDHEQFVEQVESAYDASAKTITVAAPAGLASLTVGVALDENSDFSSAFADLAGADLAKVDLSAKYGLPAPSKIVGATSLSFSVADLYALAQEYEGSHTFTFSASDREGNSADPVEITVKGKSSDSGITFESELSFDSPMDPKDYTNGVVNITVPAGVKNLMLDINTNASDPVFTGVAGALNGKDLAHPDQDTKEQLDILGLANGDDVLNKTEVTFDITSFIPLLTFEGTHKFTITVVDNNDNSDSITLTFVVK